MIFSGHVISVTITQSGSYSTKAAIEMDAAVV